MFNLNFTKEEIDLGYELIKAGDTDGFEFFIKDHPISKAKFLGFDNEAFCKQIRKLIEAGNRDRAAKLFSALYNMDFDGSRRRFALWVVAIIVAIIGLTWVLNKASADQEEARVEGRKAFIADCKTTGDALGVESKVVEVKNKTVAECWFKQKGTWQIHESF